MPKQRLPRKHKKFVKKLFKKHSSHWAKRMNMKLLVNYKVLLPLDWAVLRTVELELPEGFERCHFSHQGILFAFAMQIPKRETFITQIIERQI